MADLRWIEKTVNTAGRPCPVMRKKCPGNRQGCAWWLDELFQRGEERDGKMVVTGVDEVSGCGHMMLYSIQLEVRSVTINTAASLDKTATEIKNAGEAVVRAAKGVAGAVLLRSVQRIPDGEPQRALGNG